MSDMDPSAEGVKAAEHRQALEEARTLLDAGLVSELITETHRLATGVELLAERLVVNTERIDELADLRRRNRTLGVVALVLAGLTVAAIILAIIAGWIAVNRLTDIAESNATNGRILVECTTPNPKPGKAINEDDKVHECFERGQQQTGKAVASIGEDVARAAVCARQYATEAEIMSCLRVARQRAASTTTTVP